MSWQRERGKKSSKARDQKENSEQVCLTGSTIFSWKMQQCPHRVHSSMKSTDFLCILPPFFSNFSTRPSCFPPKHLGIFLPYKKSHPCRIKLNHSSRHVVMFKSAPDLPLHPNLSVTTTFHKHTTLAKLCNSSFRKVSNKLPSPCFCLHTHFSGRMLPFSSIVFVCRPSLKKLASPPKKVTILGA